MNYSHEVSPNGKSRVPCDASRGTLATKVGLYMDLNESSDFVQLLMGKIPGQLCQQGRSRLGSVRV